MRRWGYMHVGIVKRHRSQHIFVPVAGGKVRWQFHMHCIFRYAGVKLPLTDSVQKFWEAWVNAVVPLNVDGTSRVQFCQSTVFFDYSSF